MSEHGRDSENGQLPLPSPRSPGELDRRILAYAESKAPQKQSHTVGWVGGLATTAVLVVAVYLVNLSGQEPKAPAALKEEQASAGAASPVTAQARAKLKASADLDTVEPAPAEDEEIQMAPIAESTADAATFRAMKRADESRPDLRGTLEHLRELVAQGDIERAQREYAELRNACSECGLPETLEEALETLD